MSPVVQKIEKAVLSLKPKELSVFRAWFEEFDALMWDKQIERDVQSGKLDAIAKKAIADFQKGKFKKEYVRLSV